MIGVETGILLKSIVQDFNDSVFFCIELNESDYSFLFSTENNLEVRIFINNGNVHFSKGSFFHEGAGACCILIDPVEKMVASWFIPWAKEGWFPEALFNASAVMWSGLI